MNGLTTWLPVNAPRFSRARPSDPEAVRSRSVADSIHVLELVDCRHVLLGGQLVDQGVLWSHDRIRHSESRVGAGREHLQRQAVMRPAAGKSISTPSDRPIQLRCMRFTRSGHSRSSSASKSSSA